jgi:hypothetical protein
MSGAVPPLPQYTFMPWCSVKAQGQLYLLNNKFLLPARHCRYISITEKLQVVSVIVKRWQLDIFSNTECDRSNRCVLSDNIAWETLKVTLT